MKSDPKAIEAMTKKFKDDAPVTAKEARAFLDAKGKDSTFEQAASANAAIQKDIKLAALAGLNYATVSVSDHQHPEVKAAVEDSLAKAGFKYEVRGITGYIYW